MKLREDRGKAEDRPPIHRPREAGPAWSAFLKSLLRYGLKGVKLVVSDDHEGLKGAIAEVVDAAGTAQKEVKRGPMWRAAPERTPYAHDDFHLLGRMNLHILTDVIFDAPHSSGSGAQRHASQGSSAVDIPRIFNVTESAHRIHNPFTPEKLATLGAALRLEPGTHVLDLGSGSGEMLCTWARDYGIRGVGVDMSQLFSEQAKLRADELGVADRVEFIHGDAAGYVAEEKVGVAACVGATWIGGGVAGSIELLAKSLRKGGIILLGEPYWLRLPPTEEVARGCRAGSISDFLLLPELLASFGNLGYDVVEMVLADQDSWDRYEAAKWLTMRRWLETNPDDGFAKEVRTELTSAAERYAAYTRKYLGWGVFALMSR